MPSGITGAIYEGKETDLRSYLWRVASQQFYHGEIPTLAELEKDLQPSNFNFEHLAEAKAALAKVEASTGEEIIAKARALRQESRAYHAKRLAETAVVLERYNAMRAKVENAQVPPILDGLKNLAIRFIDESIKWDCNLSALPDYPQKSAAEMKAEALEEARRFVASAEKYLAEHVERTREKIEYLRALEALVGPRPKEG